MLRPYPYCNQEGLKSLVAFCSQEAGGGTLTLTLTLTEAAIGQRCLRHNGCCSGKVTVLVARLRRAGGSDFTPTPSPIPPP